MTLSVQSAPVKIPVSPPTKEDMNDEWRKHGETRRKAVLEQDENDGGTTFTINEKCEVERYFEISDRVLKHFRSLYTTRRNLDEIYVMGCRLERFLSDALPKHPGYNSIHSSIVERRKKNQQRANWVRERLELIALRIDEEELNKFILQDLESQMGKTRKNSAETASDTSATQDTFVDDSTFEKEDAEAPASRDKWESFSGWTLDVSMEATRWYGAQEVSFDSSDMLTSDSSLSENASLEQKSSRRRGRGSNSQTKPYSYFWSCDSSTDDEGEDKTSFLDEIATQEVEYECDSEAVDSWAQDSAKASSSSTEPLDDDARVAFHSIMKNASTQDILKVSDAGHSKDEGDATEENTNGSAADASEGPDSDDIMLGI